MSDLIQTPGEEKKKEVELPFPDRREAHKAATQLVSRIPDDVFAEIAQEFTLRTGEIVSGTSMKGMFLLALSDGIVTVKAEAMKKAGKCQVIPLNMQPRAFREYALVVFEELMQHQRFQDFYERNYKVKTEKDDKRRIHFTHVIEGTRMKMPDVPAAQAREIRAILDREGVKDPDSVLARVLSVFDTKIRAEARVVQLSDEMKQMGEDGLIKRVTP